MTTSRFVPPVVIRTAAAWLAAALCALAPAGARAQSNTPREETWMTNGWVYAIACTPTTIYIGGMFNWVGPSSLTGGVTRNNLAALDAATGIATDWNPNASQPVSALAVSEDGETVYVGGSFRHIGGMWRDYIAALDAKTGLVTAWNPGASYPVSVLAVSGSTVYAGGQFTRIGGQNRNRIAALDAATGLATTWNPNVGGSYGNDVYALAVSGSTVYAGGAFTSIGGQSRNHIAALDATTGLATGWDPNANSAVAALAVFGSTVYAGGAFTNIGGWTRNRIAAISAATGSPTLWNPNADDTVEALAVSGSKVFAGGQFTRIGGKDRNYAAALDATTGLATAWDPSPGGLVTSLAVSVSSVYVGGWFTSVGGQPWYNFAEFSMPQATLTVQSQNPDSGLTIGAAPLDSFGRGDAPTPFTRIYEPQATVTLTAPAEASGNSFKHWVKDGSLFTTSPTATLAMDADHTMKAVYQEQEIEVKWQDNGQAISDGDATPSPTDGTDFGSPAAFGATITRTFTIANVGTDDLALTGSPRVEIAGPNAADFSIAQQPSSPIGPAGSTSFLAAFDPKPGAAGVRRATLSIANDDVDEDPYDFALQGELGPPTLLDVADAGAGSADLSWGNSTQDQTLYLGFAWDLYRADWAKTNPADPATMWRPFPAEATSGTVQLDWSGAYHVWISTLYGDGSWFPCLNPWTGVLYSGTPHMPLDVWCEPLGGVNWRLHWRPEAFGTWLYQAAVFHLTSIDPLEGEWIAVDGPSGTALWHYVDYGGFAYNHSKANFFNGWADFTLPSPGAYRFFINAAGWLPPYDPPTTGDFASVLIEIAP